MKSFSFLILLTLTTLSLSLHTQASGEHIQPIKDLIEGELKQWASHTSVVSAIKAQNVTNSSISKSDIDRLDSQWRSETSTSSKPLIKKVLSNSLSKYLQQIKDNSEGKYTEIFVMDNKGLNVGQSDVTSDYWQGDEDKWQKTYLVGDSAIHISEVEEDESTQTFQSQASFSIVDTSGEVIGAITVGINIDSL